MVFEEGLFFSTVFLVANTAGSTADIRHVDHEKWQHDIREALRAKEWQHAEARRSNLHGIGQGIIRDASTAALLGGRLGPKKDGMLRAIISDWTQERKFEQVWSTARFACIARGELLKTMRTCGGGVLLGTTCAACTHVPYAKMCMTCQRAC